MASLRTPATIFILLLFASTSPVASSRKVLLSLYYETRCPYCSNFIVNHLPKIFSDGLISIVDLQLVPYGNAQVGSGASITCQHGPYECLLNTVEACAISVSPNLQEQFKFVYCIEQLVVEDRYTEWESCFQKTELNPQSVVDCYNSGYGQKLELQYAAQTDGLQPPHTYVPWVVVDEQPLYDDYANFEAYICKAYDGELPNACRGLSLEAPKEMKEDEASQACHMHDMIRSSPVTEKHEMKIEVLV